MTRSVKDCPSCGRESRVTDSRKGPGGAIRRRRKCPRCGRRWTTHEIHAEANASLTKGDVGYIRAAAKRILTIINHLDGDLDDLRKQADLWEE